MLGQRLGVDQLLRVGQAFRDRTFAFAARRGGGQRGVALLAPALAFGGQPLRELGQFGVIEVAEQFFGTGVFVMGDAFERCRQVGARARRQRERRAAGHQRAVHVAPQAVQALAQAGVGLAAAGRRPKQGGHAFGTHRSGQGSQRQQRRVFGRQPDQALPAAHARCAQQVQLAGEPVGRCGRSVGSVKFAGHASQCRACRWRPAKFAGEASLGSILADGPLPPGYRAAHRPCLSRRGRPSACSSRPGSPSARRR